MNAFSSFDDDAVERLRRVGKRETVLFPELQSILPDSIHAAGLVERSEPTCQWDGRRRGRAELAKFQYTISGRGRLRFDDRQLAVEPGQAMLVHLPNDHHHWVADGERWEFFYVTLSGHAAVTAIREILTRIGPVVSLGARSVAVAQAADACAAALENRIKSPLQASGLARDIVEALYRETAGGRARSDQPRRTPPAFLFEVEQFCWKNIARPIRVNDMAQVARLSRFHFSRMFEQTLGISPARYVASIRLEEAKRLLSAGESWVKEVAQRCGFSDANYLCKVFRKNFGVSPGTLKATSQ